MLDQASHKLVALALTVAVFVTQAQLAAAPRDRTTHAPGDQVSLLPITIGSYRIAERWSNELSRAGLEEGALYRPDPSNTSVDPIQLDFYRHAEKAHNGILCYLTKGEVQVWRTLRRVRLHDTTAVFDVALLRADDRLRLVAATECTARGCEEAGLSAADGIRWRFHVGLSPGRGDGVVPFSLVLTSAIGTEGTTAARSRLLDEFQTLARQIDLVPAQLLAATQRTPQSAFLSAFARGIDR